MVADLIGTAHEANTKVGICGQAPSDYPQFTAFLVKTGIDSMSLNPDSVIEMKRRVAQQRRLRDYGRPAAHEWARHDLFDISTTLDGMQYDKVQWSEVSWGKFDTTIKER